MNVYKIRREGAEMFKMALDYGGRCCYCRTQIKGSALLIYADGKKLGRVHNKIQCAEVYMKAQKEKWLRKERALAGY